MSTVATLDDLYLRKVFHRLKMLNNAVINGLSGDQGMKNDRGENRLGGFYCHANEYGQPLLGVLAGRVSFADLSRYKGFAEEKAQRLGIARQVGVGHTLSRQSEMPDLGRFRGAVAGPYSNSAIRSFSGYAGSIDEIISMWMGVTERDYEANWAAKALVSVRNEYFERLKYLFSTEFLAPFME